MHRVCTTRAFLSLYLLTLGYCLDLSGIRATTIRLDAPALIEQSVSQDLVLSESSRQIELEIGQLFEDDGPASGHSYKQPENREMVTSQIWIKKELEIPNPKARAAYLVVPIGNAL